ncbi:Interactor of constitutive active ROPs 3 [Zea mays]|uniref:Interactor of constitutive active ROPs 3 n=1 Tax=Zea mays TaxID=4577 RepID=A0A1D6LGW7_MAIZE|nr:Interactor of constitutive active ROPs 3 [Zea mays]
MKKSHDTDNAKAKANTDVRSETEALQKVLVTTSAADANGSCGSYDPEIEQLRTALEVAEIRYQEQQTRMTIETGGLYETLESVRAECARELCELRLELKNKNDALMEAMAGAAADPHRPDAMQQPELEAKLMRSITDAAELKACLMDKENALQSLAEENEALKAGAGRAEAELRRKYEAAVAELELAKAAEQDVRMRLGLVTDEADRSSLRVQSDQWRKAAEAAAAALGGGGGKDGNGGTVERTGSLGPEYGSSIGGKLMSSPFSDDVDEESPKRRNGGGGGGGGVLRRMSGLWKKSPK